MTKFSTQNQTTLKIRSSKFSKTVVSYRHSTRENFTKINNNKILFH